EKVAVVVLHEALLPRTEGALRASVLALDRLRHVDAAQLLERMLDEAVPEDAVPRVRERLRDGGYVGTDRLRLGPRRAVAPREVEVVAQLVVGHVLGSHVADARHGPSVSIGGINSRRTGPAGRGRSPCDQALPSRSARCSR